MACWPSAVMRDKARMSPLEILRNNCARRAIMHAMAGDARPRQARRSHAPSCIDHGATNCARAYRPSAVMRDKACLSPLEILRNNCARRAIMHAMAGGVSASFAQPARTTASTVRRSLHQPIGLHARKKQQQITSIRSKTGYETPSSACTRRPDEIGADGFFSSSWPEQVPAKEAAAACTGGGGGVGNTASRGPTTIAAPESQFRTCPSDHDSIGYPRMSASGESSTTMHRILHASGSHPIPPPNDPKTNQYNQDLGLIHSTNGNHLESPNEGSSIDHQVTIYLHAQNITMFPTNETWYFASQILVSSSGGLILILTAQSTRNMFRIHSDC
ncbi:hypothetical protein F511_37223 [Dorcoceras hygrometricum]|uniref:Uncharacterized protein n=1 Tax=Dorcoceras hygrometricum TaxID=472368 RepID=A0A2Z7CVB6_9LAMI|nr:hypothetical protein F511_37223 [Dorcoceras hygrometricum]